jgi:hypothetical protein
LSRWLSLNCSTYFIFTELKVLNGVTGLSFCHVLNQFNSVYIIKINFHKIHFNSFLSSALTSNQTAVHTSCFSMWIRRPAHLSFWFYHSNNTGRGRLFWRKLRAWLDIGCWLDQLDQWWCDSANLVNEWQSAAGTPHCYC